MRTARTLAAMHRPPAADIPHRVRALPVDAARRLPVPYFATWIDGRPDFRLVVPKRIVEAIRKDLCWICGQRLGTRRAFNIGPMCAVNRVAADPPSHRDCAIYAATHCPFLSNPRAVRRATGMPGEGRLGTPPGIMLRRNPGVALVWVTRRYTANRDGDGVLFRLGDPETTLWFADGRPATRAEVLFSIDSGYPDLLETAAAEGDAAVAELETMRQAAMAWVPAA